jgi:hypothetical protein
MPDVPYPNQWPKNDWNGIIFGEDDLVDLGTLVGDRDTSENNNK